MICRVFIISCTWLEGVVNNNFLEIGTKLVKYYFNICICQFSVSLQLYNWFKKIVMLLYNCKQKNEICAKRTGFIYVV